MVKCGLEFGEEITAKRRACDDIPKTATPEERESIEGKALMSKLN